MAWAGAAVLGPVLVLPAQAAGESWFGWNKYTGPWVFAALFFIVSLTNAAVRLRPDPLTLARELRGESVGSLPQIQIRESFSRALATPNGRLAVTSMIISQMTMVAVMTMTPVHLKAHDHESISSYVVSLHIAGMYAFSPLVGRFADRKGRLLTILSGSVLLVLATVLAALSGDVEQLLFPSLWALGVGAVISGQFSGWNYGLEFGFGSMLAATVIITIMYVGLTYSIAEMSPALPHTGGAYSFARASMRSMSTGMNFTSFKPG